MSRFTRPAMGGLPGNTTPPGTKWICVTLIGVSLLASLSQRKLGFGSEDLIYSVPALLDGELWRLLTYPFVENQPLGLLIGALVLWMFGRWFEGTYGTRDFLRFFFAGSIGAGVLAVPLYFLVNALGLFQDFGVARGPNAAIDALLVAMAMLLPDSNILFGFVLPLRARNIVYLLLAFELISGILNNGATLSITLGGMLMGYLLVSGNWRPRRLLEHLRLVGKRRRRGLYVVPPRDNSTLH